MLLFSTKRCTFLNRKRANKACTGRLGLGAIFGAFAELWQVSVSRPFSLQPPVTNARRLVFHYEAQMQERRQI